MKKNINHCKRIARLSAAMALAALPMSGFAQPADAGTIATEQSKQQTGMTYGEWSAVWWQYVLSQPTSNPTNPLLDFDTTGENCKLGQTGSSPVFFLVGANVGTPVTRYCNVPAGKKLFFPLVNLFNVHVEGDGLDDAAALWENLALFYKRPFEATGLYARLDHQDVASRPPRRKWSYACAGENQPEGQNCTPAFSLNFPDNNLFGIPKGLYAPAVAEGYYLMLEPLPVGYHTLEFGGSLTNADNTKSAQKITYHLLVTPKRPSEPHQPPRHPNFRF